MLCVPPNARGRQGATVLTVSICSLGEGRDVTTNGYVSKQISKSINPTGRDIVTSVCYVYSV